MKHVFRYILASFVLLVPALAHADDDPAVYTKYNYKIENGVGTRKVVSAADEENYYTLTLETFATGLTSIVKTYTPVDVILILDTSNSMHDYTYTYKDDNGNSVTATRLEALKYAVGKFVDQIAKNDGYDDDGNRRLDANGQETVLGNRIQIVTFNTSVSDRFTDFQPAFANVEAIKTNVSNIGYSKGTRTDEGLKRGITWVQNSISSKPNSKRVVVMFTDGCPSTEGATNFNATYAISAVNNAYTIKNTTAYGGVTSATGVATVYSIGLIDWSALSTTNQNYVREMMDYISSNYPDGQASSTNTFTCTGTRVADSFNFYVDANETDLGVIFQSIAEASGGSENTIPGETQLVDEVSSSFDIPSDHSVDDLVIYTRSVKSDGSDWDADSKQTLTKVALPADYDLTALPPADAAYMTDENKVGVYLKDGKLMIIGFNYSKPDSEGTDGTEGKEYDGNWVGWRPLGTSSRICAGKELVVELKIEAKDGVTGGDNTNTNKATSGVYIPTYDENNNFTGYVNATLYPYPETDLPINLIIWKEGLKHGESATIQIYRAPQKTGEYDANTGKPAPDLTNGWENFSKVILTNKNHDGDRVVKTLLSLDPKYVYRLVEDDWGWGYNLDQKDVNTSAQVSNPFIFTNTEKATTVKHAEAVSINHFGTGAHTESYKSSKTTF